MLTFDANILFYAGDDRDSQKRDRAAALLRSAAAKGGAFLTLQALGEFVFAAVRKGLLSRREAAGIARDWASVFDVKAAGADAFEIALDWWMEERLSYWDAMLVATAAKAGATALITEDLSDGAVIGGVEFINLFAKGADKRLKAHMGEA